MNIAIIVFSPSGHTLKAAKMIQNAFEQKGKEVRLVNITGKKEFLYGKHRSEILEEALGEYDLFFIGGPLYAGHVEHHILNTIKALPLPDEKHANLAVPFVSYGGVHSSVALEEMGQALKDRGCKSLLGIKIAAKHTLTTTMSQVIYEEKPGVEEESLINEAVERVLSLLQQKEKIQDQSEAFRYVSEKERELFRTYTQEKLHQEFKNVSINTAKCIKCKKCITVCPVDMFSCKDGNLRMHRDKSNCILCAECFHNCPSEAIEYSYLDKARMRLKDGQAELEKVPSAIYPS